MSTNTSVRSSGIGFCGLLGLAFIILKLCKVITWPWIWVLAPLWLPTFLIIGIILALIGFALLGTVTRK